MSHMSGGLGGDGLMNDRILDKVFPLEAGDSVTGGTDSWKLAEIVKSSAHILASTKSLEVKLTHLGAHASHRVSGLSGFPTMSKKQRYWQKSIFVFEFVGRIPAINGSQYGSVRFTVVVRTHSIYDLELEMA